VDALPPPQMTTQTLTVLSVMLSDPDAECYGLQLSGRSGLKPGTIYPILDRLLKAGWLERRWEGIDPTVEGRPRRRLYRLTAVGAVVARQAFDDHLASLQQPERAKRLRPGREPGVA
jgi:PadR family transcriptional regulator, regulatory protein PadR